MSTVCDSRSVIAGKMAACPREGQLGSIGVRLQFTVKLESDPNCQARPSGRQRKASSRRSGLLPVDRRDPPFADLLTPHGVVESFELHELVMTANFYDAPAFADVNGVGVHDGGHPVRDGT